MCAALVQAKAVQQYVEDLLDQEQKFLIFCHHKSMNDAIAEVLNKLVLYQFLTNLVFFALMIHCGKRQGRIWGKGHTPREKITAVFYLGSCLRSFPRYDEV